MVGSNPPGDTINSINQKQKEGASMIVVITIDEEVNAILSKAGKKPIDMATLHGEYLEFLSGAGIVEKLVKDKANLTKKGTVRKDLIRKELKKRQLDFYEFLIEHKKFKAVEFISYEI